MKAKNRLAKLNQLERSLDSVVGKIHNWRYMEGLNSKQQENLYNRAIDLQSEYRTLYGKYYYGPKGT